MKGSVLKRCTCPVERNGKGERLACKKDHGSWYYIADVPGPDGRRRQAKRGGFSTRVEAQKALNAVLEQAAQGRVADDERLRVGPYLDQWLATKVSSGLRPTTAVSYRLHIDRYLKPQLGGIRLRDLGPPDVERLLQALLATGGGAALPPATVRRVHATLRSALSSAVRKRMIAYNPARDVDLPRASRPKVRPGEPAELGQFLDSLGDHPLAAYFELVAATGLRRGEALGLRWEDVDMARRLLVVRRQLLQVTSAAMRQDCPICGATHAQAAFGVPKTRSGDARSVELDLGTVGVLSRHAQRQGRTGPVGERLRRPRPGLRQGGRQPHPA